MSLGGLQVPQVTTLSSKSLGTCTGNHLQSGSPHGGLQVPQVTTYKVGHLVGFRYHKLPLIKWHLQGHWLGFRYHKSPLIKWHLQGHWLGFRYHKSPLTKWHLQCHCWGFTGYHSQVATTGHHLISGIFRESICYACCVVCYAIIVLLTENT